MVAEQTGNVPLALQSRPEGDETLEPYLRFYAILRHFADRDTGRISFQDMVTLAKEIGDDPVEFVEMMVQIDRRFIKEVLRTEKK